MMKTLLRNFYFNHIDPKHIVSRINDGKRDLACAYPHAKPITAEQRQEIQQFWKPYVKGFVEKQAFDMRWFDVYNQTNVFGENLHWYIPDGYYYAVIDTFFNNSLRCPFVDDKNLYDLYFHDVNQAKTICRKEGDFFLDADYKIISKKDAVTLCSQSGGVILKPSVDSWAGCGIKKWNAEKDDLKQLEEALSVRGSLVVQELIKQHESMAQFNDSCVNTLRIVTMALGNTVDVVTAVAIMGGKGAFTNHLHGGGLICGVNDDGTLRKFAFDGKLNKYEQHPNGAVFADCKIPNYHKCTALVKDLAPRLFGMSRLTAWDIALDAQAEPLLIEANFQWGGVVQKAAGPVFGERTEEVLKYVHQHMK